VSDRESIASAKAPRMIEHSIAMEFYPPRKKFRLSREHLGRTFIGNFDLFRASTIDVRTCVD
jgi:hypothetical protein